VNRGVELRSDTFTLPTEEMYQALTAAQLGDDVYHEDPTVTRLQDRAAELTGHEAALFVTSATQANLVAVLVHTHHGDEVIVGRGSDLYNYESNGLTAVAGVFPRPVIDDEGLPSDVDVMHAFRAGDVHHGDTRLLAIEQSHAASGGRVATLATLARTVDAAHSLGVAVHLDGARLFNAAIALEVTPDAIARPCDSVTFSLSKGLACPGGAMLCGPERFIAQATAARKMLGGGMRQAGWLASPGLVALDDLSSLQRDHANARMLAELLANVDGIDIDVSRVQTNIVYFAPALAAGLDAAELASRLATHGVRAWHHGDRIRMVVHRGVCARDIARAADAVALALAGGFSPAHGTAPVTPFSDI
jgi:threonine aldolase